MVEHFNVAILLNPELTNNDVVDTAGGVCPGVGFVISAETREATSKDGNTSKESTQTCKISLNSLGQLQCDDSFGLSFYTLTPELEFWVDGTMEDKILLEALSMKGTDRRVMTHLL